MKTLFARIVLSFTLTLVMLVSVLGTVLFIGYHRSTAIWSESRIGAIQTYAEEFFLDFAGLQRPSEPIPVENFTMDVPLFLYDINRVLVATNRGTSRHRGQGTENLEPVYIDSRLAGYYAAGTTQFRNDASNVAFLNTLVSALVFGSIAALLIGIGAGIFLSRSLVKPANLVSEGIDTFARGNLAHRIPETGTREIARIAQAANIMAQRLSREREIRSQWAQDITHDLRTPVASIKVRLEAFLDGVFEPTSERIKSVQEELGRMEDLIADLEELTRLETPELVLDIQPIDLASFMDSLEKRFASQSQARNLTIQCSGPKLLIHGDEPLLYRAVSNLVSNAVSYSFTHTVIAIQWGQTSPKEYQISVSNTGPVLTEEQQEKIFTRLYRTDNGRTSPGSGLGLTITQQIVTLHGGTITVKSSSSAGTVFSLTLPVHFSVS